MEIYRCSWGLVGPEAPWRSLIEFVADAKAEHYAGVEFPLAHLASVSETSDEAITPEFGPPPYMNVRPFTHEPDTDLVELNAWMRDRLKEWF